MRLTLDHYNDVVVPTFAAAYGGEEPEIAAAMRVGFGWIRKVELMGAASTEPLGSLARDLDRRIHYLIDLNADKVKAKCTANGGFEAFRRMLGEIRQLTLIGHAAKAQELTEALPACSRIRATFRHAWVDQKPNASLTAVAEGSVTLNAPTVGMIKTGSLPHGDGDVRWTTYRSTTVDTFETFDTTGKLLASCATTTTGTGTTGSKFTLYVQNYGLSFVKGGGRAPVSVLLWHYGTYNGSARIPMGVVRRSTSTCPNTPDREVDGSFVPWVNDPYILDRGDGMRIVQLPWKGGEHRYESTIARTPGALPVREEVTITLASTS